MLIMCSHRDRINSLWWLQHLNMVNKLFEDMVSVSLVVSLSFCYTVLLELQSHKLLSVMLNPTSQFCLNSFLVLEGTSVCPPIKINTDIRSSMCFGSTLFTLYICHMSWNIEPAYDTFLLLSELSIKKCNNQSNAIS